MLKQIRENARVPLYILIVAFIGLYAVSGQETGQQAGKIFGRKVSISDFQKAYNAARTQLIMRYGNLPNDPKVGQAIEDEAWNRLIMLHEAKKERIKTSDKEIVDFVKGITAFNDKSGRFSKRQYEEILKYSFGLTPSEFEGQVKENLTIEKLIGKHSDSATVTDDDVLKEYKFLNEKAKADYVLFKADDYLPQAGATEEEIKAYFEKNKAAFKIPAQVNAEYIAKPFPDDKKETKEKTRKEMKDISYELAANTDLAAAAKKFSLTTKETGLFNRETNIPGIGYDLKFADSALSLAEGQVSGPIETKTGIYIIKIKEKKPERQAVFAEVKDAAGKSLKAEKADAAAKAKAQEALKAIKAAIEKKGSFEAAAKELSLSVKKTGAFARGQYIEGLGIAPEFAEAAFSVKQGEVFGDAVRVHDGYTIVKQDSIVPIDEKKYQEEKDKLKKMLTEQKKYFASITWFSELRKKADLQDNLDKALGRSR
ncbi:MAG: peptidyl-prolyl cis-trans isomerase [Candidatus Omnitrophica bacterium]|nr:peptidyl-prolyl cis-trans isomerase [Candidatus Omnitrophota bacterium]